MSTKKVLPIFVLRFRADGIICIHDRRLAAAYYCGTSVTVVNGDTLRKIAERCGTTVYALRRANPEIGSGDLIYPNQALLLPGAILYRQ